MVLVVEDGTGFANADSLCSVAFADAYHADRGNVVWATLDIAVKEQLLRKATDYVKYTYNGQWLGLPVYVQQALPFPRVGFGVPVSIVEAVAELALIAKSTPLIPNITRGKKSVKVGPIQVTYDGSAATSTMFVSASLRFSPYLVNSGMAGFSTARLVRT